MPAVSTEREQRPLSPCAPRDCEHECRACGVAVVGLTEYASHISNPHHKQRVEQQRQWERAHGCGEAWDDEYFDKELLRLIEKRRNGVRKEEQEAARLYKHKEEQRKQQQQNEERQRFRKQGALHEWGYPRYPWLPKTCSMPSWHGSGASWNNGGAARHQLWPPSRQAPWYPNGPPHDKPWPQSHQAQSATWHAEGPSSLQNWPPLHHTGLGLGTRGVWGGKSQGHVGFHMPQRAQLLLSNSGCSSSVNPNSGLYWHRTKGPALRDVRSEPKAELRGDSLPLLGTDLCNKSDGGRKEERQGWPDRYLSHVAGHQGKEESVGNKGRAPNAKDRVNRWSPYPPAKFGDLVSWKEAAYPEDVRSVGSGQVKDVKVNNDAEQGSASHQVSRRDQGGEKNSAPSLQTEHGDRDSRASSSSSTSSAQREATSSAQATSRTFPAAISKPQHRASGWNPAMPRPGSNSSGSPQSQDMNPEDQKLSELMGKAKAFLKDVDFADTSPLVPCGAMDTVLHIEEEQQAESTECTTGECGKETDNKETGAAPMDEGHNGARCLSYTDTCAQTERMHLQSVQVSTSTPVATGDSHPYYQKDDRDDEEVDLRGEDVQGGKKHGAEENGMETTVRATHGADEGGGLGSDGEMTKDGHVPAHSTGDVLDLSKLGLPRDLTRHIGTKSKPGIHEPNLNIARRIRNLSGTRKAEAEKDSGLKPTLRQLISGSASWRNVNWDHVYQEACRKKQEQGKGRRMPRFGIEMVAQTQYDQDTLSQEEDEDVAVTEGFHWESFCKSNPAFGSCSTPRKRSLSESSVVTGHTAPTLSVFTAPARKPVPSGEHTGTGLGLDSVKPRRRACVEKEGEEKGENGRRGQSEEPAGRLVATRGRESVDGYSSGASGVEQNDSQGAGKKRRAAGDVPSPEIPSLERKNKRRKIKCKKERSQVDQLLAVSLKEEELSSSLQAVENGLVQARAALQAAYVEVQRLLVVKQQVTIEISTLRCKRIEILQGMQDPKDDVVEQGIKDKSKDPSAPPSSLLPPSFSPSTSSFAGSIGLPSQTGLPHVPRHYSPTSLLSPAHATSNTTVPLHIKQEPPSPTGTTDSGPTSTSLEAPNVVSNAGHSELSSASRSQIGGLTAGNQQTSFGSQERAGVSSQRSQDGLQDICSARSVQLLSGVNVLDSSAASRPTKDLRATTSAGRRSSGAVATDCAEMLETNGGRTCVSLSTRPELRASPSEPKSGKRVRRLKKKKVLQKALGGKEPENSDTEQDGESLSRPVRKIKSRKKAKGSPAGTSVSVTKAEDEELKGDARGSSPRRPKQLKEDTDSGGGSCLEMVELPQAKPIEVESVDTSDHEDAPVAQTPAPRKCPSTFGARSTVESTVSASQTLACDEVSSTSELDACSRMRIRSSKIQQSLSSLKEVKHCSEAPLELGDEEEPTEGSFEGHQESVNCMQIHSNLLYTCSGDRTVRAFSLVTRKCVAVFEGHSSKVNCLLVSSGPGLQQCLYTGSSDQTIRCFSLKTRERQEQFSMSDRVLCFHNRWKVLYTGLANGNVVSISLKTKKQLDVFECHGPRAVSCLASAQEGARRLLLVGSYDCTISVRDAKSGLLLRTLQGHTKTVLCLKVVNDLVFSGSSDQSVHAYNIHTGELVRLYKGHSHAVTAVTILGKVMITACLDKLVRVYELQSHDRLQVYSGHKDMVMCMAVHKSMIYTGCYDGSVQAVRLNLIRNHRCWWHGCSLIFGVMEHLQQHLLTDHVGPTFQTLRCRWKNCDTVFTARSNTKQDVPRHMLKHSEEDSKPPA